MTGGEAHTDSPCKEGVGLLLFLDVSKKIKNRGVESLRVGDCICPREY